MPVPALPPEVGAQRGQLDNECVGFLSSYYRRCRDHLVWARIHTLLDLETVQGANLLVAIEGVYLAVCILVAYVDATP
jgi:hypothetical protein